MKIPVSPSHGIDRPRRPAVSSTRTDVVPTARTRPPRERTALDRGDRGGHEFAPLRVHRMLSVVVRLDGPKRAEADVQRHEGGVDAALRESRKDSLGKV